MEVEGVDIACIFDLDGVLVDTAIYHYRAWKKLANSLGFDFNLLQNEALKGVSRMQSLDMILGWGGITKTETEKLELADLKNTWYIDSVKNMSPSEVLPGSLKLLKQIRSAGIKIALGSASKNSGLILKRTGLARFFDVIVDGNTINSSKPDPEVFLKGAALLNTPPGKCIVFEDAAAGVQAAVAANMTVVGIGLAESLPGADMVIKDLSGVTVDELIVLAEHKTGQRPVQT